MFKVGGRIIHIEIHKLINSIWNKEKLPEQWKGSIIVPVCKNGDGTDWSNYNFVKDIQNFIVHPAVKVNSIYRNY